jgi:hypothetical protein
MSSDDGATLLLDVSVFSVPAFVRRALEPWLRDVLQWSSSFVVARKASCDHCVGPPLPVAIQRRTLRQIQTTMQIRRTARNCSPAAFVRDIQFSVSECSGSIGRGLFNCGQIRLLRVTAFNLFAIRSKQQGARVQWRTEPRDTLDGVAATCGTDRMNAAPWPIWGWRKSGICEDDDELFAKFDLRRLVGQHEQIPGLSRQCDASVGRHHARTG